MICGSRQYDINNEQYAGTLNQSIEDVGISLYLGQQRRLASEAARCKRPVNLTTSQGGVINEVRPVPSGTLCESFPLMKTNYLA